LFSTDSADGSSLATVKQQRHWQQQMQYLITQKYQKLLIQQKHNQITMNVLAISNCSYSEVYKQHKNCSMKQ